MKRGASRRGAAPGVSPAGRRSPAAPAPSPPADLSHPATLAAIAVAAGCVAISATAIGRDTDFWQHLAVGRAIWALHHVPTTQLWSWPTYGAPDVNSSWGFRLLIWPCWKLGGLWGLFAWRWLTSLAAIGILYATARHLGARGYGALAVSVVCAEIYSQRIQTRPETLVAVLFAATVALLESRRLDARVRIGRDAALVALGWIWVNSHISSPFWFTLLGVHAVSDLVAGSGSAAESPPGATRARAAELPVVMLAGFALSLVNPFGIHALEQPFGFLFSERGDAIFRTIAELGPLDWRANLRNGYPFVLGGWTLLALWRAFRRRPDVVELLMLAGFGFLSLRIQRFTGFFGLAALPYLARDLAEWTRAHRAPAWNTTRWTRAALASAFSVLAVVMMWGGRGENLGVRLEMKRFPVAACDFLERHAVRGRAFNPFHLGGYLLYRFWPDRSRLPFMDVHQSGTPRVRADYMAAMTREDGWRSLRDGYAIDWIMGWRIQVTGDRLLDFLDADTSFALVFLDDAAALFVRRRGALAAVADSFAYRELPAGRAAMAGLGAACEADSARRARVRAELERQAASSRWSATAYSLLANIALQEGRWDEAQGHLRRAIGVDPTTPRVHERLALAALEAGDPAEAGREIEIERRLDPANARIAPLRERVRAAGGAGR
jgi:hypothetical protein